jgi:hypothetical protein
VFGQVIFNGEDIDLVGYTTADTPAIIKCPKTFGMSIKPNIKPCGTAAHPCVMSGAGKSKLRATKNHTTSTTTEPKIEKPLEIVIIHSLC